MKISAEGFDYDKKGDIEGLRYNVLLKFGYGNIPPSAITGLSTIFVLI